MDAVSNPWKDSNVSWRTYQPWRRLGRSHAFVEGREKSLCGSVWHKETTEESKEFKQCQKCHISLGTRPCRFPFPKEQLDEAVLRIRGQREPSPKGKPYICGWKASGFVCYKTYPHDGLHTSRTGIVFDSFGQYGETDPPPLAEVDFKEGNDE